MIEAFKILTRLYDGRVTEGMLDISRSYITRGNALKLVKHIEVEGTSGNIALPMQQNSRLLEKFTKPHNGSNNDIPIRK